MKKIIYIVKTQLHYYPPCVSQIRMIKDLGYDITVLYGTSDNSALDLLKKEKIESIKVGNIPDESIGKLNKLISWFKFRGALSKQIKQYDSETLFWFGTAESIIPMKGKLKGKKYVVSLLELLDDDTLKRSLLKNIVKKALAVTVCEETRGYIMKYWWGLKKLPYVFPNKPYNQITDRYHKPTNKDTEKVVNLIKNRKIILYQGIIQNTEELCEIAEALKLLKTNYLFLLMGIDKYNSAEKIKQIYNDTIYLEYIPAPYHLEITSYAYIGITFYRNDSLNKAFCAPNKIYEYSGFGIPILANDVPGLKNTIGKYKAAECIELKRENIVDAILKIENNYSKYSKNAIEFFESTDNKKTMNKLLDDIKKM